MPFVTVTVVTVVFLRVTISPIIYITIYISISYKYYKGYCTPHFLIVTTVTVTEPVFTNPCRMVANPVSL